MLLCTLFLSFLNRSDRRILWAADRALDPVVLLVDTPLMERVFAEEVNRWQVEGSVARCTAPRLEDNRLRTELINLFAFRFGFSPVGLDEAAILRRISECDILFL